jgi:hypothetical protein
MSTSNSNDKGPSAGPIKTPAGNHNVLEKAAAPLATVSSHADPWPHYIMTGACESVLYLSPECAP